MWDNFLVNLVGLRDPLGLVDLEHLERRFPLENHRSLDNLLDPLDPLDPPHLVDPLHLDNLLDPPHLERPWARRCQVDLRSPLVLVGLLSLENHCYLLHLVGLLGLVCLQVQLVLVDHWRLVDLVDRFDLAHHCFQLFLVLLPLLELLEDQDYLVSQYSQAVH